MSSEGREADKEQGKIAAVCFVDGEGILHSALILTIWSILEFWCREANHLGTNWKIPGRSMQYSDQTAVKYFIQCCILISCITVAKNLDYCFVIRNCFYFHEHLNRNWSVSVSRGASYAEDSNERCVRWALWLRSEECGKGVSLFPYGDMWLADIMRLSHLYFFVIVFKVYAILPLIRIIKQITRSHSLLFHFHVEIRFHYT